MEQDRDLSLVFDKAPIKKGDVVVGKTFVESSLTCRDNRDTRENENNSAPTKGARSSEW